MNEVNKKYKLAIEFDKHLVSIKKLKKEEYGKVHETYRIAYDSISKIKQSDREPSKELITYYLACKKGKEQLKKESVRNLQDSVNFYKERLNSKINSLVFDYAKKEGYHYVFSPAGSSAFMYGDSSLEITNQVIAYLNEE